MGLGVQGRWFGHLGLVRRAGRGPGVTVHRWRGGGQDFQAQAHGQRQCSFGVTPSGWIWGYLFWWAAGYLWVLPICHIRRKNGRSSSVALRISIVPFQIPCIAFGKLDVASETDGCRFLNVSIGHAGIGFHTCAGGNSLVHLSSAMLKAKQRTFAFH